MAAQATKKQAVTAGKGSASAVAEHPRTRPKPVLERVFDYSRWNQSVSKAEDFAAFLRGYPDKTGLCAYVYRLMPKIDFRMIGRNESYLEKIVDEARMTPEYLASLYGRGHYQIKLTDANRPRGQQEACKIVLELEDAEKPPVYDVRCLLLNHPQNQDEVNRQIAEGVLVRDPGGSPRLRTATDGPLAQVMQAPASMNPGGLPSDLLTTLLGRLDPHKSVKDVIEIAQLLNHQNPPAVPFSMDELADRVAARLGGSRAADPTTDLFTAYERVDGFINKVRGGVATGAADGTAPGVSAGAAWANNLPNIFAQGRALIGEVMQGLAFFRAQPAPPARAVNGVAPQNRVPMQQRQQNQAPAAPTVEELEAVVKLGFEQMNAGTQGFDFAGYVCLHVVNGLAIYRTLEQAGVQGIISVAAMKPETRALVNDPQSRSQLEKFLEDFFTFDPDGSGEVEPGADPELLA